jgi:hypothetical protein
LKKYQIVRTVASAEDPPTMLCDKSAMVHQSPPLAKQQKTMLGLAPRGMSIPRKGMAYVVRVDNMVKEPTVKESNEEMYNCVKHEEEEDKKKKDKKEGKKLKKEGKVCTLALTCILKYNKTEMDII